MKQASEMDALVHRLELSGADRTRWPAQERLRFAPLIAQSDQARRLVAEAAALDRVLDAAPGVDATGVGDLVNRIVAAAEAEASRADRNVVPFAPARHTRRPPAMSRGTWQAAALLAASLVLGIFAGTSGVLWPLASGHELTMAEADPDATELILAGNSLLGDLL